MKQTGVHNDAGKNLVTGKVYESSFKRGTESLFNR